MNNLPGKGKTVHLAVAKDISINDKVLSDLVFGGSVNGTGFSLRSVVFPTDND